MPLLTPASVVTAINANSWEDAVRIAGRLLVSSGAALEPYIEAMVRLAKELGPYIVITPGIAIPHARPEDGALRVGFSVVQLTPPIAFGNLDNDPVSLVIGFCSPDANAHVELLMQIARIIGQEGFLASAKAARTPEELVSIFNNPFLEELR
jgi:mannitol/fructose-specific phosphotransferase system IIA component (Ntr-type)